MPAVTIYSTRACVYCMRAKALLQSRHIAYTEYLVDQEPARRVEMQQKSGGRRSVPQIFIGDRHIGGYDDLYALDRRGELDRLLAG
ncbi:MAG TPA: glutaredoxin 3 [Gammaproteobacteria bacterium]|nr:glutaredoxin 3 [Gammaproteobacteria bacterium]